LEGFSPSVAERMRMLEAQMQPFGELASADETVSGRLWTAIRDVAPFAAEGSNRSALEAERALWRVSTAPSRGAEFAAAIANAAHAHIFYDWAGGLIWLTLEPSQDAGAALIRRAVTAIGGHATLIRAPASVRAAIVVFAPQDPAVAALTKRVKDSFDPKGVLNPGRMWAGGGSDADELYPRAGRRPEYRGGGPYPAQLCPLRLLHRDLPNLRAPR